MPAALFQSNSRWFSAASRAALSRSLFLLNKGLGVGAMCPRKICWCHKWCFGVFVVLVLCLGLDGARGLSLARIKREHINEGVVSTVNNHKNIQGALRKDAVTSGTGGTSKYETILSCEILCGGFWRIKWNYWEMNVSNWNSVQVIFLTVLNHGCC